MFDLAIEFGPADGYLPSSQQYYQQRFAVEYK